jgi:RNA polymerase sigma-70 factor (ECF subfamily)
MTARAKIDYEALPDADLARRIAYGDALAVRLVTRRNNQRLFRVAWSILKHRPEAEDAVQSAYLKAFTAIEGFQGASSLSTWLTRIVINEALERRRKHVRDVRRAGDAVVMIEDYEDRFMRGSDALLPDGSLARDQIRLLLERAIARLPDDFRLVFVLREIEGSSIEDAAEALGVPAGTIKTRHLRARRRLQQDLGPELQATLRGTFPFAGADCAAMSDRVVRRLEAPSREP